MKFLRDDNWDNDGYCEYLKSIQHVFDSYTGEFLVTNSFHDGRFKKMELINHCEGDIDETKDDPTSIRVVIEHWNGSIYELVWDKVKRFYFDYDITRNIVVNTKEIVDNGRSGIDDWGYDEILITEDKMFSHEIELLSKTRMFIICRQFQIKPYSA
ncbi:hypothetical protein ABW02_01990 [Niallia circulans]|uniref:Uncharacterized protein n=1 Tax=Niallia circulans TaxID=1397 RepID=A0A0J1IRE6_NIACI|nr:hypothetical protein [Niallia circulans]KLV28528.1 hypothetical protein ABW02_01990 [Niallia circulans]